MQRFIGIDVGGDQHALCILDESGKRLTRFTFGETHEGYERLKAALPEPGTALIGMEATGHYWRNLFATLVGWEHGVVVLNPLVTKRHSEANLARAKTDRVDAESIARFLFEKRPATASLPDETAMTLKELVRWRERIQVDLGAKRNALHRLLDMVFPEFTRLVKNPVDSLALHLLDRYPLATDLAALDAEALAAEVYDGRHYVGAKLSTALIAKAQKTVGRHQTAGFALRVRATVSEVRLALTHLDQAEQAIRELLDDDEQARLLKSIPGIGNVTAAVFLSEVGDVTRFQTADHLVSFVGFAPRVRHSGKSTPTHGGMCKVGPRHLRSVLWMAALVAVRYNPTIRAFYQGLVGRGKSKRAAIGACAAKLLRLMHAVLRRKTGYRVPIIAHP